MSIRSSHYSSGPLDESQNLLHPKTATKSVSSLITSCIYFMLNSVVSHILVLYIFVYMFTNLGQITQCHKYTCNKAEYYYHYSIDLHLLHGLHFSVVMHMLAIISFIYHLPDNGLWLTRIHNTLCLFSPPLFRPRSLHQSLYIQEQSLSCRQDIS